MHKPSFPIYTPLPNTLGNPLCKFTSCETIRIDQEPDKKAGGFEILNNPMSYSPFLCPEKSNDPHCDHTVYASNVSDARTVDAVRGIQTRLDTVPYQVYYDLVKDNVSNNPALDNYGQGMRRYQDINAGQITYYVDKSLAQPFYSPVYNIQSEAVGYIFKDPMDSIKPNFNKAYPSNVKTSNLSFLDDSSKFREDIIARQQRTHNSQKYELIYQN